MDCTIWKSACKLEDRLSLCLYSLPGTWRFELLGKKKFLDSNALFVGVDKDMKAADTLEQALVDYAKKTGFLCSGLLFNNDTLNGFTGLGVLFMVRENEAETVKFYHRMLDEMVPMSDVCAEDKSTKFASFCKTEQLDVGRKVRKRRLQVSLKFCVFKGISQSQHKDSRQKNRLYHCAFVRRSQ